MEILQPVLGHHFADLSLLRTALTHGSVSYEGQQGQADNQRLEFLGDAVLQLALSEMLYRRLAQAHEGILTQLRAQLVSAKGLARVARRLQLGGFLIMGRGEEANGGRERDSNLADALEAIAGAVYLDAGMDAVQAFVRRHFLADLEALGGNPNEQNPKGQLQELLQALGPQAPTYQVIGESGPDHAKSFETLVQWNGRSLGRGLGRSKKEAEVEAARQALRSQELASLLETSKST